MKYIRLYEDVTGFRRIVSNNDDFLAAIGIKVYRPNNIPKKFQKEYDELPFHVGDIVKIENNKQLDPDHIFIIDAIEINSYTTLIYHIETFKKDQFGHDNLYLWTTADSIFKVPDYEVDAINYNL